MGKKDKSNTWENIAQQWSTTLSEGASAAGSWFTGEDSGRETEKAMRQAELDAQVEIAKAQANAEALKAVAGNAKNSSGGGIIQRISPATAKPGMAFRVEKALKGAAVGGAAGFVTGSVVPGIGNVVGTIGGMALGAFAADNLE